MCEMHTVDLALFEVSHATVTPELLAAAVVVFIALTVAFVVAQRNYSGGSH